MGAVKNHFHDEICAAADGPDEYSAASETARMLDREIADLAEELLNTGLVNRGVDRGLVVVEKADRSDPHYRLCLAVERRAAFRKALA